MSDLALAGRGRDSVDPTLLPLEHYFAEFMAFFFPQAHGDIEWEQGHEFLDKELQRVAPDAEVGRRWVDKLVTVWREGGELEASDNPFAIVVMAHLKAQETQKDVEGRKRWKLSLIRRLYERGYSREDIVNLFRFIDWVLQLPEEVEEMVWQEVRVHEEKQRQPYITSVERIGYRRGAQQGRQEGRQEGQQAGIREGLLAGIELGLKLKFDGQGVRLLPEIYKIQDVDVLRAIHEGIEAVDTVEELRRIYA